MWFVYITTTVWGRGNLCLVCVWVAIGGLIAWSQWKISSGSWNALSISSLCRFTLGATGTFTTHCCNRDTECCLNGLMLTLMHTLAHLAVVRLTVVLFCSRVPGKWCYMKASTVKCLLYFHVLIVILLSNRSTGQAVQLWTWTFWVVCITAYVYGLHCSEMKRYDSFDQPIQSIRRLQLLIQHRRELLLC